MLSTKRLRKCLSGYRKEARKIPTEPPNSVTNWDLITQFPAWLRSQAAGLTPLGDESPWMSFSAIRFLDRYLRPDMTVFEYGSGGSTIFFARRAGRVITVEHDEAWFQQVAHAVQARVPGRCEIVLLPPTPLTETLAEKHQSVPGHYLSADAPYKDTHFENYVRRIDECPDDSLDLVVIDGRARVSCLVHAYPKIKPGGILVLDNAERNDYRPIHERMGKSGWRKTRFFGPGPYNPYFWETSLWQRPS